MLRVKCFIWRWKETTTGEIYLPPPSLFISCVMAFINFLRQRQKKEQSKNKFDNIFYWFSIIAGN